MKHFQVLSRESARYDRKTLKLRCYQERQTTLDKIAREICSGRHAVEQFAHNAAADVPSKVSFAFFGRCSIRHNAGHPPCPTKKFIRAFARIVPTFAIDEFRTSSRCCDCHAKLQSVHGGVDEEAQPIPYPGSSNDGGSLLSHYTEDNRHERCEGCGEVFPHDSISCRNMLFIALAMLQGQPRPAYLSRGNLEEYVHEAVAHE